jgi:hypothetical protein
LVLPFWTNRADEDNLSRFIDIIKHSKLTNPQLPYWRYMLKVWYSGVQSLAVLGDLGRLILQLSVDFFNNSAAIKRPNTVELLYREIGNFDFEFHDRPNSSSLDP